MALTLLDIGWIAGIIEGEGSFTIDTRNNLIKVQVSMTDPDVLDRLFQLTGIGGVFGPYDNKANYPLYTWEVGKQRDVSALMMTIYPIMGERRQARIKELLSIWKSKLPQHLRPCKHGHPRTKDSYYIDSRGRGSCKVCRNLAAARFRGRRSLGFV